MVRLESNLYEAREGQVIWSMHTDTAYPESVAQVTRALAVEVGAALRQAKLVGAK